MRPLLTIAFLAVIFSLWTAEHVHSQDGTSPAPDSESGVEDADFVGAWQGNLKFAGQNLRIALHIALEDGSLTAKMDSVDQGALGIPADSVTRTGRSLAVGIQAIRASFDLRLTDDGETLTGKLIQGVEIPIDLKKVEAAAQLVRPQEPVGPFPYLEREVSFAHRPEGASDDVVLAGTLTMPKGDGPFPAAILVTGSGPQNRNAEIMGHKSFWVIADHLTRRGFAVLRYDDRGVGKSTGDFQAATTSDFADDAVAGVRFLMARQDIDGEAVGVIGHSEGGWIAPMVFLREPKTAFTVLLAGGSVNGRKIIDHQSALLMREYGMDESLIAADTAIRNLAIELVESGLEGDSLKERATRELAALAAKNAIDETPSFAEFSEMLGQFRSPWLRFFLAYDPAPALAALTCPTLALTGALDLQVDPAQNNPGIVAALEAAENPDYTVVKLPRLNHLFQTSESGSPAHYGTNTETFAPRALDVLSTWLVERFAASKTSSAK